MLRRLSRDDMKDIVKRMSKSKNIENRIVSRILDEPSMLPYRNNVNDAILKVDKKEANSDFLKLQIDNHMSLNNNTPYVYINWNDNILSEDNSFTVNEHLDKLYEGNNVTPISSTYVYCKDSDKIINISRQGAPIVVSAKVNTAKFTNLVGRKTRDLLRDALKFFNNDTLIDIGNVEILSMSTSNNLHLGDMRGSFDLRFKKYTEAIGGRALVDSNTIFINRNVFSSFTKLMQYNWFGTYSKPIMDMINVIAHESQHIVQFKMGRLDLFTKQKRITDYIGVGIPNSNKMSDFLNYVQALNESEAFLFGTWFTLTYTGFNRNQFRKKDFLIMEFIDRNIFLKLLRSVYKQAEVKRKIQIFDETLSIYKGLKD